MRQNTLHLKVKVFDKCVMSVLIYGTEIKILTQKCAEKFQVLQQKEEKVDIGGAHCENAWEALDKASNLNGDKDVGTGRVSHKITKSGRGTTSKIDDDDDITMKKCSAIVLNDLVSA